jgi:MoaA/NifB/PqqE/SkfB family radical SAM enzyme
MKHHELFVTQPFLPPLKEFLPYLERIWDSKLVTNCGPFHQEFEQAVGSHLGVEHVALFTNGSLIDDTDASKLVTSGINAAFFSIDTGIPARFDRIRRGLSHHRVESSLAAVRNEKSSTLSRTPIIAINAVDTGESNRDIRSVYDRYRHQVDRISVQVAHNWTDSANAGMFNSGVKFAEFPCPYPYFYLTARFNGDVSICCFDFNCKTVIGNLVHQTVREVWHSHELGKIRKALEEGDRQSLSACRGCTQYPNWWARLD